MAKLIGTAPNQVPTNADLGSLAYMDKDNFDANISELTLGALSREITGTAVDIFVYDTRKDSDGGAWRKRTQHTSWYNEAASSTRGSRKEFPAVAVIVLRTNAVTIYDGDDPDLPMWWYGMSSNIGGFGMNGAQAVSMLNGLMVIGQNDTSGSNYDGLRVLDFVRDYGYWTWYNGNGSMYEGTLLSSSGGVTNRSRYYPFLITSGNLVAKEINDVAMTVLPNAPIDAATGLPVPTIAVGTQGGTSIIRDDGTVVDYTLGNYTIPTVDFDYDNNIIQSSRNIGSGGGGLYVNKYPILSADSNSGNIQQELVLSSTAGDNTSGLDFIRTPFVEGTKNVVGMKDSTLAFSSDAGAVQGIGVYQLGPDGTTKTTTLGAVVTSDYNTGWMNGDIKLATLSDTDDTDVTGSELVTNGTFDTDTTGWSAGTHGNGTTLSLSGNELVIASDASSYGEAIQSITLEANTTYVFTVYIAYSTQIYYTRYRLSGTNYYQTLLTDGSVTNLGWQTVTFTTGSTVPSDIQLILSARNDVVNQRVDNISIRKAEEDRSVNGNGLQVFGTVTKTPVATGADLVGYSGFSASNYLEQPYNSALDFGTGDYSIMGWFKIDSTPSGSNRIARRAYRGVSAWEGSSISVEVHVNNKFYTNVTDEGYLTYDSISSNMSVVGIGWVHFCVTKLGTTLSVFLNGKLDTSLNMTAALGSLDNTDAVLTIGNDPTHTENTKFTGSLALQRWSATAPSPEQIKKIYEDEKVLFQENAQATLYGSSDAVTALAYDDSTDLLHVGTSAGRSVFQGLRRVDNTTDAVGAAISASNSLVAED